MFLCLSCSLTIDVSFGWRRSPKETECFPLCQKFRKFRSEVKWKGTYGLVRPEYSGAVVHFVRLDRNLPLLFWQTGSMPWVLLHRFWVSRENERFDWKLSFHFSLFTTTGLWSILLAQWRAPTESSPDLVLRHAMLTHRERCVTTRGQWFDQ